MIKRMNKLTALLVAGTAVASIAPSVTANAATKLATQEGNIDAVQAFNNGKYIYEGYKEDSQDNGIYYSNGSKDVEIDDVDTFDFTTYGKNFVNFTKDEVLFNLETGKADEDTLESKTEYLQTKFNTQVVKKVNRYKGNVGIVDTENPIKTASFGDVWYKYEIKASKESDEVLYTGIVNADGSKYVETDYTLNITQYLSDNKTNVTIDDMDDKDLNGYNVKFGEVIYADADYIYRTVTVAPETTGEEKVSATYLQKISKAQGSTEDEAYLPKNVTSYLIEDSEQDGTKADNKVLTNAIDNSNVKVIVSNGSLFVVKINDNGTIKSGDTNTLDVQKYDLVKTRDTELDIQDRINRVSYDEDFDFNTKKMTNYDIDVDGNVWVLYKGEIQKLVKGELQTVYTTDRTMNQISVYDADDIVVWNTDNEIFATVAGKQAEDNTTEEDKKEDVVVNAGWVKNSDGTWSYNKADGTKATGWLLDGSTWYYLNANGIMQTGWLNLNGTWYYLNNSGAMQTGWLLDGSTWYYMQSSGAMKTGWLNDNGTWYYLNSNGSMKTGWLKDTDGNWYFLQSSGAMASNTTIDGYKLGSNGAWIR